MNPTHEELLKHGDWLRRLAFQLVRDAEGAEEVVQETWLTFLRKQPRADVPTGPWLARVLRNKVNERRRWAATNAQRERDAAAAEATLGVDDVLARAELQRKLAAKVFELDESARNAVLLRYYEGMKPKDIAARLGCSAGTVRSQLSRGLDTLRARLDEDHGGERRTWAILLLPLLGEREIGAIAQGGAGLIGSQLDGPSAGLAKAPALKSVGGWTWLVALAAGIVFLAGVYFSIRGDPDVPASVRDVEGAVTAAAPPERVGTLPVDPAAVPAPERVRLVAATTGKPLAHFSVRASGGTAEESSLWTSDANGFIEIPPGLSELFPVDDPRVGELYHDGHERVWRAAERAPLLLSTATGHGGAGSSRSAGDDQERALSIPVGPAFALKLKAPARIDVADLEARLVPPSASEYRDDGRRYAIAPVRSAARGVSPTLPWIRFAPLLNANADGPWTLELRHADGHWFGRTDILDVSSAEPVEVLVALEAYAVLSGTVTSSAGEPLTDDVAILQPGDVGSEYHQRSGAAFSWDLLPSDGSVDVRWIPPGTYTFGVHSKAHESWSTVVEIQGGETLTVDPSLVASTIGGRITGTIGSASGELAGRVLIFLMDDKGASKELSMTTLDGGGALEAVSFEFRDVPDEALRVEVVVLGRAVSARVEPSPVTAPQEGVTVVFADVGPASDVEFKVMDAATGLTLTEFEVDASIDGGLTRTYIRDVNAEGELGWWFIAGAMRWARAAGAAPLVGLPDGAALTWRVRAKGYESSRGDRTSLETTAAGRALVTVELKPR